MQRFKTPLIVTAIVLPLMLIVGLGMISWIYSMDMSNRKKAERAGLAGSGVATMGCIVMAPFWLIAAAKLGKEKRAGRR